MKRIIFSVLLLSSNIVFVNAQNKSIGKATVTVDVKNLQEKDGKFFLRYGKGKDSAIIKDDKLQFSANIDEPTIAYISFYPSSVLNQDLRSVQLKKKDYYNFYLTPNNTSLIVNDSIANTTIDHPNKDQKVFQDLSGEIKEYDREKLAPLAKQYTEYSKQNNKEKALEIYQQYDSLQSIKNEKIIVPFIKKNASSSPVALSMLSDFARNPEQINTVDTLFQLINKSYQTYPTAKALKEKIDLNKATAVGKQAIDFTQNDTLGKPVSLHDFKGKYVLVDFWASWCGPCRGENPNVVAAFQKYKDKNFTVLGVSFDSKKDKWLEAIHADGLAWNHVSDLQYWNNAVGKIYGIHSIPSNLLLDKDGKIIAKNIRGEDLQAQLAKIFGE